MSRFIGKVLPYLAMIVGWTGVGLFMIFAPARFGKLVHDSLMLFPAVRRGDWGKTLLVRGLGLGLLAFTIRFALLIIRGL